MILLNKKGESSSSQKKPSKKIFKESEENVLSKAGRIGYKSLSEGLSSLLGFPAAAYNFLAPVGEKISEKISGPSILDQLLENTLGNNLEGVFRANDEAVNLPRAPRSLTPEGLKENIFKPAGEKIFGSGSMDRSSGFLEDVLMRGSQILPLALSSGMPIGTAAATTGLQSVAGESSKALGAGPLLQSASEIGAGLLGPLAYKASMSRSIPKAAKNVEKGLWSNVEKQAAKEINIPISRIYDKAEETLSKASRVLPGKEKKVILDTLASVSRSWGPKETSAQKLIDSTRKIFNTLPEIKSSQGKKIFNDFRVTINKGLDNILQSYPEARSLTRAIKNHPYLTKIAKNSSPTTNRLLEGAMSLGKIAAIPAAVKIGSFWSGLGAFGAGAAYTAKNMAQDYKLLQASPTLKKMFTSFMRDISKGSIASAASKANDISKYIDKDKYKTNFKPTMKLVD